MTETPEQTDPDAQSTATADPAAAGARLREVRESKGISPAEVAAQLHLNEQTIRALERDDHEQLPAPIYVRGYVRAYARLLGLDEEALLALYQPAESPELRTVGMPPPAPRALVRPRLPWRLLGGLLLVAVVAALAVKVLPGLWERLSGGGNGAPVATEESTLPEFSGGVRQSPPGGDAEGPLRLPELTTPSAPEPAPVPEPGPEPELPVTPAPEPAPVPAEPEMPAAPPAAEAPPATAQRRLQLELEQESWISIRAADGERLLVGLYPAGSEHTLNGRPPLQVVLGNAAGVRLTVDGEPYSLSGYAPGSVARFTLE